MNRTSLVCLGVLVFGGCGGGGEPSSETTTGNGTTGTEVSASADPCVAFFTRQRECANEFVPELVALRVRLDQPAGIAARDASGGRDALVAEARTEYTNDSTDGAIATQCQGIMGSPDAAQAAEGFRSCLAQAECSGFVPCDITMLEQHMRSEAAPAPTPTPLPPG